MNKFQFPTIPREDGKDFLLLGIILLSIGIWMGLIMVWINS